MPASTPVSGQQAHATDVVTDDKSAEKPSSGSGHDTLTAAEQAKEWAARQQFRIAEYDRDQPLCDAKVPSFHDDETLFDCGHHAEVEALWLDGRWHPRCQQHVNGYPANRVRPLGGGS